MNYDHLVKHLSANALLWTGIAAIALTLLEGSFYFLLFFAGLLVLNFFLIMILNRIAPGMLKHEFRGASLGGNSNSGNIAFKFAPLKYPKVLDEETREYVPELIRIDINNGNQTIFSGNMARNALKQFQNTITDALAMKDNATTTAPVVAAPISEKKKVQKKAKK